MYKKIKQQYCHLLWQKLEQYLEDIDLNVQSLLEIHQVMRFNLKPLRELILLSHRQCNNWDFLFIFAVGPCANNCTSVAHTWYCLVNFNTSTEGNVSSGSHVRDMHVRHYPVGTQVTYYCADGVFLSGPNTRICQPSGKWSEVPPVCRAGN